MASKTTLNARNLEALGVKHLAELLIELSTGSAAAKRRLRLELAGAHSTDGVAQEIRKRLASIARSRSTIDWQKRKALVKDLDTQRRAVVELVAPQDPPGALALMWQFLGLASSVLARCDDSSGAVIGVFHQTVADLEQIASAADPEPTRLADDVARALLANDHGQYDHLIRTLAPALGPQGLEHLKSRMMALVQGPRPQPAEENRQIVGYGRGGPVHIDGIAERSRLSAARLALRHIADAQGDVDAFMAQYDAHARKVPTIAAEIARRLLGTGRAEEAWSTLEAAEPQRGRRAEPDLAWEDTRVEVLEVLGQPEEAQAGRWSVFERALSVEHLRAYLKRLPDFEDMEAEERALTFVQAVRDPLQALVFLVSWPALERASELVIRRASELDGDHYEVLTPAAEALAERHPLAATLALRAMIDFALSYGRSSRYRHAARHLLECESLASSVPDWGAVEPHQVYVARLRARHGRKSAFWSEVG